MTQIFNGKNCVQSLHENIGSDGTVEYITANDIQSNPEFFQAPVAHRVVPMSISLAVGHVVMQA